jgi:hypothetical protein
MCRFSQTRQLISYKLASILQGRKYSSEVDQNHGHFLSQRAPVASIGAMGRLQSIIMTHEDDICSDLLPKSKAHSSDSAYNTGCGFN